MAERHSFQSLAAGARVLLAFALALLVSACAAPGATVKAVTIKRDTYGVPHIYAGPKSGVPQIYDFLHGKDKDALIRDALVEAVSQLAAQMGGDMSKWLTPVTKMRFSATTRWAFPGRASTSPKLGTT